MEDLLKKTQEINKKIQKRIELIKSEQLNYELSKIENKYESIKKSN